MVMVVESVDAVIGVDTHTDTHTACLVEHRPGNRHVTVEATRTVTPNCLLGR